MLRYKQKFGLAGLTGLLTVGAMAISAVPAGATEVCKPGFQNPIYYGNPYYCQNVQPVATTKPATKVKSESATLNGIVGPNVANGDSTTYDFEYGTKTSYGKTTPPGTVGGSGHPATSPVSFIVRGLKPCTRYHYRVDAKNSDGSATGNDQSFKTAFLAPISNVSSPRSVQHSRRHHPHSFTVKVKLKTTVNKLTVALTHTVRFRRHGHRVTSTQTVESVTVKNASGTVKVKLGAPNATGKYDIKVVATLSCGSQTVNQGINVR